VLRANTAAMDMFGEALAGEYAAVAGDLVAGKRRNAGRVFRAVQQAPTPTANLKFRVARHNGEIHSAVLHV